MAQIADVQGVGLPAAKARLRRGQMMLVDSLAQGRERRDALRGVPLRCWDARSNVSDYLNDGLPASDRVLVERHLEVCPTCPPLYAALVGTRVAMGALRDADTVVPCRWPTGSRNYSPRCDPGGCPARSCVFHCMLWVLAARECADGVAVLQLRLQGNRRAGRSTGVQVHRCSGATLDMTESICMPQPLQVAFPQRSQRAGLHMWCSSGWL